MECALLRVETRHGLVTRLCESRSKLVVAGVPCWLGDSMTDFRFQICKAFELVEVVKGIILVKCLSDVEIVHIERPTNAPHPPKRGSHDEPCA